VSRISARWRAGAAHGHDDADDDDRRGRLAGVPGLAGFFSKDEILHAAFAGRQRVIWALLLLGAFLTAFYTFRLLFLAFFNGPRMSREVAHHVHESRA